MFSPATRSVALAATALLAGISLAACSGGDDQDSGRLQVVAAFYPLQYAAERVAGEHADVSNLTQPGKEPHDLSLSVSQVADVATADLVVFEDGFQAAVDSAVEEDRDGPSVNAADAVELKPAGSEGHEEELPEGHEGESAEEHAAHEEEEDHHEHEHEHEHGDLDPHFWQDPLLVADLGDAIAKKLSGIDPAHADDFAANAAALRSDLEALDGEFSTGLQGCERDTVVVNHDAFGYLTKYGVHLEAISGLAPDSEPNAATISDLHDLIREHGITTVFSETLVSPRAAEAIAGDLGIETAVLDPLEGLTAEAEENDGDYLTVMRQNLAELKKANAC
ncbi:metal ABC transporter substrate-binding protein [Nocardioides sp.]|uniref:metal ABC transporter substrate-binding protein n=1 Tax=Nocardioides sp. TaxID=35761 RepID=UPI002BAF6756|nr:metal ABC transporter substrate-binding protein [Nocardioides sp.]HSX66378.1 metal ABC transporter substrate-binding protein [Nocardioides sp.]